MPETRETHETKLLFKAQGTFRGSRPAPHSPYQTATPFFSNAVLGQQIWPGDTNIDAIHQRLSIALNDRHNRLGIIGDWRETHDPQYWGYWSFYVERFVEIRVPGEKTRYDIIFSHKE